MENYNYEPELKFAISALISCQEQFDLIAKNPNAPFEVKDNAEDCAEYLSYVLMQIDGVKLKGQAKLTAQEYQEKYGPHD